ncbi:MAG: acyl-CoA thioesterase [Candidatus Vogelbacteria bacterium]|nr:acyl-CoA thioesterase [Candidatus Vogelbacteria bacterium]
MDTNVNTVEPTPKTVAETAITNYPYILFSNDLNANRTVFGGKLLEIADRLAGSVAITHSGETCVTVGIDEVRFIAPAREGDSVIFKCSANRVWSTSMEVGIKVIGRNLKSDKTWPVFSAYFTFVAVDKDGKKLKIRPLIPETVDEKRRYEKADARRERRLAIRK